MSLTPIDPNTGKPKRLQDCSVEEAAPVLIERTEELLRHFQDGEAVDKDQLIETLVLCEMFGMSEARPLRDLYNRTEAKTE